VRDDGTRFSAEILVGRFQPVRKHRLCFVVKDVTAENEVKQALLKEQNFFNALMDNMVDSIYFKDTEARFTRVNRRMWARFGVKDPEREFLGKTDFDFHPPAHARGAYERDMRILRTGEPLVGFETRIVQPDGGATWISSSKVPLRDRDGRIVGLIGITRDITERKLAEEELKKLAARLEASNRELEGFASVASHDLQEPLRKIQSFGEMLAARHGGLLPEEARGYLDRMQNAANRMRSLINDLLAFSRVTSKARPFAKVDLGTVAREVVSDLETRIGQVKGRVEIGDLPVIEADPMQMRQLLQNLIGNALKFHRENGLPVVRVHSRMPRTAGDFSPGSNPAEECCRITVEDNSPRLRRKVPGPDFRDLPEAAWPR